MPMFRLPRRSNARPRPRCQPAVVALEARTTPSAGGGFTNHGLDGTYYSDANFTTPAFARRDPRLDFDWGTTTRPGGSISPGFRDVGVDNYSVRWTGQLVARFAEAYSFNGYADDAFKLELKPAGSAAWAIVVDQPAATGANFNGSFAFAAGVPYDVRVSYREFTGAGAVRLRWSSPSTPLEVIDTLDASGNNNPDGTAAFADIVKGARNSWGWGAPVDANGWPMGDAEYVFQESLNQGLGLDPLMRGRIQFSFHGRATVGLYGNVNAASLTYAYDAGTNTTAGSFVARDNNINASLIRFTGAMRNGQAGGPAGFTDLRMLRPTAPDAATNYPADALFTTALKDYNRHFTVVRYQTVANQQEEWSDRTLPSYFNQDGGSRTAPQFGNGDPSNNGWSWEYKAMFANETGTDLMLSIPTVASGRTPADTQSYLAKLANLLRYGSDGVEPYTSPQANPVYPPLNPNLRVYLELENELWNTAGVFNTDYANLNGLVVRSVLADDADFHAINYDNLSSAVDGNGNYVSMGVWRYRIAALRMVQASDIFRGVFGDSAMPGTSPDPRIRPLYEWQYDNLNDTARLALTWVDRYFNKADPASTYAGAARPVNYYLWGGGGATYYGAVNGNGLTTLLPNSGFDATTVPNGYTPNPAGASWAFAGTAGIARDAGGGDDIPAAFDGGQVGYVAGTGRATATFTVPAGQTSNVYGVSFKAHNRRKVGATAGDTQNLRVYLDYGTANQVDLTAKTFSQPNGYVPPDIFSIPAWLARNVAWTNSQYYYTKTANLAAGSTHTVTFVGTAAADQAAFLDDVRVTSVDAIFAGGIPGGGEATGQPVGSSIRRSMGVANSWAAAFGLRHLAYEGGWSLGGDDGGSAVQLKAKYGDTRTADAQGAFMDDYAEAGGDVNVFGTYAQIPSWGDSFAQQGLLDAGAYPIVQGIDGRAGQLRAGAINGTFGPAALTRTQITLADNATAATGQITAAGGWLSWNVVVPRSGVYVLRAASAAGGALALLADDVTIASGTTGADVTGTTFLTAGLHALKVRSTAGGFTVNSVTVAGQGAPAAPDFTGLAEVNGAASLTWSPVAGAAGYVVRYGTAAGQYTLRVGAGTATARTVAGLAHDTTYFFAVAAVAADGTESLPSNPRSVQVLTEGQVGHVARWEFTGLVGGGATVPATVAASGAASGAVVSALGRGAGLVPANTWVTQYNPDRFSSFSSNNTWATTLADAVARNQYYQFTVAPAAGKQLTLSELHFQAWFSDAANANNRVAVRTSTDGTTFADIAATGTPNAAAGYAVSLAGVPALANPAGTVTFRIYTYGTGNYNATGIGLGTSADDLFVLGGVRSVPAVEAVTVGDGSAQRSMVRQLVVRFNTLVNLGAGAFAVTPLAGGAAVPIAWTTADIDGQTLATITFGGGSIGDGRWRLTTTAAQVTHRAGGGPAMAADRTDDFVRLYGDANGDAVVNAFDFGQLRPAFGASAGDAAYRDWLDFDGDGVINAFDFSQFRSRFGSSLP